MRRFVAAVVVLLALSAGSTATAVPTRDALVRPGVGIGDLRLGMSLRESLRALDRPVVFEYARVFPREGLRYIRYRTKDRLWRIGVFGIRGRERVGMGTLVATLPVKLRAQQPVCIQRYPLFKGVYHDLHVVSCAVRTTGIHLTATTVFSGSPTCAVPVVRYQGCMSLHYRVASIFMESQELIRYNLSWWYPVTLVEEFPTLR